MLKNVKIFFIKFTIAFIQLNVDGFSPWHSTMIRPMIQQVIVQSDFGLICVVTA